MKQMSATVTAISELREARERALRLRLLDAEAEDAPRPAPRRRGRIWLNGAELGSDGRRLSYLTHPHD